MRKKFARPSIICARNLSLCLKKIRTRINLSAEKNPPKRARLKKSRQRAVDYTHVRKATAASSLSSPSSLSLLSLSGSCFLRLCAVPLLEATNPQRDQSGIPCVYHHQYRQQQRTLNEIWTPQRAVFVCLSRRKRRGGTSQDIKEREEREREKRERERETMKKEMRVMLLLLYDV